WLPLPVQFPAVFVSFVLFVSFVVSLCRFALSRFRANPFPVLLLGVIAAGLFLELPASPGRRWWLARLQDSMLRREAALHSVEPWPQYVLGMRLARRGQLRSAMEALRESTRRARNEPLPLLGAAEVWMNAGRP